MKEFTIEETRNFVKKGYTSVAARFADSILTHYDESFDKMKSELTASMVMHPKNECDNSWNQALKKSIRIIEMYKKGEGILQ
jgi:hypothetical protein